MAKPSMFILSGLLLTGSPARPAEANPEPALKAIDRWLHLAPAERGSNIPRHPLSEVEAAQAIQLVWNTLREEALETRKHEMHWHPASKDKAIQRGVVKAADKEMTYLVKQFGEAPQGKRSLWISMHGGGGTTRAVNDRQWRNQIQLYAPKEGFYLAPRAPTDTWNLWHQGHIDALFDRLIEDFVIAHGVDPNRVYLMGYSAGGDGVYQLAPRMADRFAAAAMMAGHPNDASPAGLRNLPFMIFVGGKDAGYKRNTVAAQWGEKLARLRDADPDGYVHKVTIYPGLGHWMGHRDAEALPWMAAHERHAWPKRVVWKQSSRTHDRFYWLGLSGNKAKKGQELRAEIKGQVIELYRTGVSTLLLRLNDALIDLDQPITVHADGRTVFEGKLERRVSAIWNSLNARLDPSSVATAGLEIGGSDP